MYTNHTIKINFGLSNVYGTHYLEESIELSSDLTQEELEIGNQRTAEILNF